MEIRENKVRICGHRFTLEAALSCEADDPGFGVDRDNIIAWAHAHAEILAAEPYDNICRLVAKQFPRIVTVEVTDPESGCGVILYPWPGE